MLRGLTTGGCFVVPSPFFVLFWQSWGPARFLSSSVLASVAVLIAWFDNLQKALCAPQLEQDWCSRLLQKKLTFGHGTPLLSTIGFDWDYCGKEDLAKDMRASVQKLHEAKGRGGDKQAHPLFIAFAGPGQGKSRLLSEFPGLVAECLKDLKNRRFSDEPLAFLLTCENGLGPGDWGTEELNARRFVACRMLWQLRDANQEAFDDAGAPTNFAKFRAGCDADLVPEDVFGLVLPPDQRSLATVVMGVDGMQNLPGFPQRGEETGKRAPFYQVMREVCRLVNQDTPPFVVACVTATQSVSQSLADSSQARTYLKLPRVTAVTRKNRTVLPPDDLIQLLTVDMGGHGRALEGLEEALNDWQSMSASALVGAVISKLYEKYPDAVNFAGAKASDVLDLLRASLSGKVLGQNQTIGGLDPTKTELVRVVYLDKLFYEYRIDIPYIWLQVMLSQQRLTPDLDPWKLLDYGFFERPATRTWQAWELFNADFRVLRSCSFEDGQAVKIGLLHRGAIIRPRGFEHQEVRNRHLTLAKAKSRLSSKSSCCGHPKPNSTSSDTNLANGLKKFQCRVTLAGKDVVVSMADKTTLVVNGAGAPAADAFLMLGERTAGNEQLISECLQFKMGSSIVKATEERHKACDNNDILVLLLNRAENSPESQDRLVFVSAEQFEEYFGLYAGRAFLLKDVKIAQDPCVKVPLCPAHLLS